MLNWLRKAKNEEADLLSVFEAVKRTKYDLSLEEVKTLVLINKHSRKSGRLNQKELITFLKDEDEISDYTDSQLCVATNLQRVILIMQKYRFLVKRAAQEGLDNE